MNIEKMDLTGIKDLDYKILNNLEDRDLVNVCQTSKKADEICNDQMFWLNRIMVKFPYLDSEILNRYKYGRSWSEYYINDLRKVNMVDPDILLYRSARENGREDFVLIALNNGADINYTGEFVNYTDTPLLMAIRRGNYQVVKLLLDNGADPNISDNFGSTPLISATHKNNYDMVKLLLDKEADVNLKTVGGLSALQGAIINSNKNVDINIIRLLLEKGSDPNILSGTNKSMRQYAIINNRPDVDKLLEEYGGRL